MQENRLIPDFREETVQEYTETYTPEGGEEQSATYKIGSAHPIIGGILDKFTWIRTHVAAIWWNKLAGITLKDKIDQMDASQIESSIVIPSNSDITNVIYTKAKAKKGFGFFFVALGSGGNIPSGFNFATGFVTHTVNIITIVLFNFTNNNIALNSYTGTEWTGWKIHS